MNPVIIRGVSIGEGMPKICVSLTSKTKAELLEDVKRLSKDVIDLVEWRVDHFENLNEHLNDHKQMTEILETIREQLGDVPVIVTHRSVREGGAGLGELSEAMYGRRLKITIDSGLIDLVDIELFMGDETVSDLIAYAHAQGVKVIVSNHDFIGTPTLDELVKRLRKMQALGGDILKIAVMPGNMKDVLTLLEATVVMSEQYAKCPVVTIAMSDLGAITRVTGEVFGSAITFGQVGKPSAPGQIAASKLIEMLENLHQILPNENKL